MSDNHPLILASQSEQRAALFATLDRPFLMVPADIDELAIDDPDHYVRAAKVAQAKAEKVSGTKLNAWIVTADTFVVLGQKRLEKPNSLTSASQMLHTLSGKSCTVYTGWCVMNASQKYHTAGTVTVEVIFRSLSSIEVDQYVKNQPVTKWAGGFSIINPAGMALTEHIHGSLTSLLGLPIEVIRPILDRVLERETIDNSIKE